MHDGCRLDPIETGAYPQPGPAPFWINRKPIEIRRGTERILALPAESTEFFRPR